MDENSIVRAPYNFVPFSKSVLIRYKNLEELPGHDVIDPDLKTGEIHITMEAETPVFISDGTGKGHFFQGANGKYMIPGSSVRGMTRENMQILGFGLIRPGEDIEDYQIYFREIADKKTSARNYYSKALAIKRVTTGTKGRSYWDPRNVQSGYLRKENGKYWIIPTKKRYLCITRKKLPSDLNHLHNRSCQVAYLVSQNGEATQIQEIKNKNELSGMKQGTLLFTGKPVGKPNRVYLFPEADPNAEKIEISKEDEISYMEDWEKRKNVLKPRDFWKLPTEEGEEKAVFFIRHEGHIYFGMSRFLRIGYKHALSEGLPPKHRQLFQIESDFSPLDYPHAILGFAEGKVSYRSRVSFGDLVIKEQSKEENPFQTILAEPKPSFYPGYVVGGKSYVDDDFQLRGYKLYWLKEAQKDIPETPGKAATTMAPLPPKTKFEGIIRYKNLHEDELGLLLWALRLEDGCYQSLGMGKPYGFGRIRLTIDSLQEFDFAKMYTPEGLGTHPFYTSKIDDYIQKYDNYASEMLKIKKPKERPSIHTREEIEDFFWMRSTIRDNREVSYMKELDEYKNIKNDLPDVKLQREKTQPLSQETKVNTNTVKDDETLLAELLQKFNGKPPKKTKRK